MHYFSLDLQNIEPLPVEELPIFSVNNFELEPFEDTESIG